MFQPVGIKTLMQIRSASPEGPDAEATKISSPLDVEQGEIYADHHISDMLDCAQCVCDVHTLRDSQGHGNSVDSRAVDNADALLEEASSFLHQLQDGWSEERQHEISRLWKECEADYGFTLSRDAPGTPALGSLRARAGYGAAGFLGGSGSCCPPELPEMGGVTVALSDSFDEAETDQATEAAAKDLEAAREWRKQFEARFESAPKEVVEAPSIAQSPMERLVSEAKEDVHRLASLRVEVDKLRAQAEASEVFNANEDGSIMPPTSAATAALRSVDLAAPELGALDQWMEDIAMLDNDGTLRQRNRVKAVASPMRARNSPDLRSPAAGTSTQVTFELGSVGQVGISSMEVHLDHILNELDAIDRIHADVCMLANS
jgi:hypothetical protein